MVGEKIKGFAGGVQDQVKTSATSLGLLSIKILSGAALGLTIGLVFQELFGYGDISLVFVLIVITGLFTKLTSEWTLGKLFVFDLICVLVAKLLQMYLLLAP